MTIVLRQYGGMFLKTISLSSRLIIWLLPYPPLLVSKLSLFLSLPVCRRSSLLAGVEGEGEGAGEEPNHTTDRRPGPL
jgi:hypothetical protein